ncbi:hypothetical protein G9F72_006510 [Clostridium estertheticum]|uniref:hypothetical protein n=1 Tax=Clostridium estertheticum TaxID=238834 RepID=UPI0013E91AA5|nr:hypothetical protein [Clostridium estertheticum]MBZ9685986.1 hypothetical protein [Clostridium estertheticum]
MDNDLELLDCKEPGYNPIHNFESWIVAILNYEDQVDKLKLSTLERHNLTDEIFVLQKGKAYLIIGGIENLPINIKTIYMEKDIVYNVKRNAWHNILMSEDARVLIVENNKTGPANSQYINIEESEKNKVLLNISKL